MLGGVIVLLPMALAFADKMAQLSSEWTEALKNPRQEEEKQKEQQMYNPKAEAQVTKKKLTGGVPPASSANLGPTGNCIHSFWLRQTVSGSLRSRQALCRFMSCNRNNQHVGLVKRTD